MEANALARFIAHHHNSGDGLVHIWNDGHITVPEFDLYVGDPAGAGYLTLYPPLFGARCMNAPRCAVQDFRMPESCPDASSYAAVPLDIAVVARARLSRLAGL